MRIAVCMKQVPAYSEGNMDEKTGVLIRTGLETVVNTYDMAALEAALLIRESTGAEVTVFTMGPASAELVLREAFARGADKGCLICDTAFAGADVLATSYTLMQAIKSQGVFDLILCGRQTTDGDTAQVSGELAQWMEIPHCSWVTQIEEADEDKIVFWQQTERVRRKISSTYPCLISVEKTNIIPRMPSLKLKMAGRKKPITNITLQDLEDQDREHYGLRGSATRVKKIFPPQRTQQQSVRQMEGQEAADYIGGLLGEYQKTGRN